MRSFVRWCRGIVITLIAVLPFCSYAQSNGDDAFNILQSFDYSNDLQGHLPDRVQAYLYDDKNNILYILGHNIGNITELGLVQELYIWQYDTATHLLTFVQKSAIDFPNSEYTNFELVAKIDEKLILSTQSNLDLRKTLSSIYLKEGFKFVEEAELFSAESGGQLTTVQSSDNTIFSYAFSADHSLLAKHCVVGIDNIECQDAHGDFPALSSGQNYSSYLLDGLPQFMIYSSHNGDVSGSAYIVRYDEMGKLSILNELKLPSSVRIDRIATRASQGELFIYSNRPDLYSNRLYHFDGNAWSEYAELPAQQVRMEVVHYVNETNYGVSANCRPVIYSQETLKFYYTNQTVANHMLGEYCMLVSEEFGFRLGRSDKTLTSFELVNTQPAMQLESLSNSNFLWTQDKYNEIDLRQYFSNVTGLTINGLPAVLKFDGEKISGQLGKDDLFVETSYQFFEPIGRSRIEVYSGSKSLASFFINFVNINDAPELISPIAKEYLKSGVSYEILLSEIVRDPDYDSPLSYTFTNLPSNATHDGFGGLKIISAKTGEYKIGVTVDDGHGGVLKFTLDVEVNDSGSASSNSSGGGVGIPILFLLLILCAWRYGASSASSTLGTGIKSSIG